jgi:exonuclease SbcC
MHLNKLILHNFKKYRRAEIEFQDGLTGIVGGNGTGKSTIVEAIAWALYGNRASIIKREFLKNTEASENEPVEVQLSLSIGRQDVAIYRGMRGRALVPEARLKIDGRQVAAGTKEVDSQLESLIRISFQDFMKTFYARQKDLDNLLREGGTGKREYLLKLLGLDEIREAAVERIKLDLKSATTEKERLAGALSEIGDVESRLKAIEQQIAAARSAKDQAMVAEENAASAANDSRLRIRKMEEQKRAGDQVLSDLKRNCARRRSQRLLSGSAIGWMRSGKLQPSSLSWSRVFHA